MTVPVVVVNVEVNAEVNVVASIETNAKAAMETIVMTGKHIPLHWGEPAQFKSEMLKRILWDICWTDTETIIDEEMTEEDLIIIKIIQDHHPLQFMVRD